MSYARTPQGLLANVIDIGLGQETFYWPWLVVGLCWVGVVLVIFNRGGEGVRSRTFRLLPLCAGVSSILFFTLVVARCEHRFVLPFGFWLAYYGGLWRRQRSSQAWLRRVGTLSAVRRPSSRCSCSGPPVTASRYI